MHGYNASYGSPPFSLVRLTFGTHRAAPCDRGQKRDPLPIPSGSCLTPKPRLQKAFVA
jgi:hypothetical protein